MKNLQFSKPANDATGISLLLYGPPGSGKTHFLGTIPGKTLILDMDRGTKVLKDSKADIDVYHMENDLSDLKDIFLKIRTVEHGNICIDTVSELEKAMLVILGLGGKLDGAPELGHYKIAGFKLRNYIRQLRDLTKIGKNVIVTAWEMPYEKKELDGTKHIESYPMVMKSFADELCGLFDIVGRIEKDEDSNNRTIHTTGTNTFIAKDRIFNHVSCQADGAILFNGGNDNATV